MALDLRTLTNELAQCRANLEGLVYLRPELQATIEQVVRLVNVVDEYVQYYHGKWYQQLCRLMIFEHDISKSVIILSKHLLEIHMSPSASPETRLCMETMIAICRGCLRSALELYEDSEREAAAVGLAIMPADKKYASRELKKAQASVWDFQYRFHLGQARRYNPESDEAVPSPVSIESTSPLCNGRISPVNSGPTHTGDISPIKINAIPPPEDGPVRPSQRLGPSWAQTLLPEHSGISKSRSGLSRRSSVKLGGTRRGESGGLATELRQRKGLGAKMRRLYMEEAISASLVSSEESSAYVSSVTLKDSQTSTLR